MTLHELSYLILEGIRANKIVDDENIDIRLIQDWINLKRDLYIKNARDTNPNNRLNLNIYQKLPVDVEIIDVEDAGDYPFINNTTQSYKIVQSIEYGNENPIPSIIEDKNGPIVLSVESVDAMKLPFTFVSYDQLKFSGNGKFNSGLIYGAIRDNNLFFKYHPFFEDHEQVVLRAVFQDPRQVTGYDTRTSEYPANMDLIEYIKNGVYDKDVRMLLSTKPDVVNDASGIIG